MKKANLVLSAALAAAGLVGFVGGTLAPTTVMAAAAKKPALSAGVLKPLKAAQDAMNAKNWEEAYTQIQEALTVEGRTAFDDYQINEFLWFVQYQRKQLADSATALEAAVNSGFVPPEQLNQKYKLLLQLNLMGQNFAKAVEYGNKYVAANPADAEATLQLAQGMYFNKDYAGAKALAEKQVAAGGKPSEDILKLLLRSNVELKNDAGSINTLELLVRHYPAQKYWEDLVNNQLFRTRDERALRQLYRLMADTNTLDKGEEYSEMGNLLITGGYPAEARKILEQGMAMGVFAGDAKNRAQGDLDRAKGLAATDAKDVPNAEKAIAAAKTGNSIIATGKLLFSAGEYARAAEAFKQGLAKGGVTDLDDANMLLGIALFRSGKAAEAAAPFSTIKDAKMAEVARLWKLKLEGDATAAAAPAG